MRRPPWEITVTLITVALLPLAINIATNTLPSSWRPHLWLAWPASIILATPIVATEIRRHRSADLMLRELPKNPEYSKKECIWNIPVPDPHFSDRDVEFAYISTIVLRGAGHAVLLHGMAGVGKTQLALTYAIRRLDSLDIGWWIPAKSRISTTSSLAELAEQLGINFDDQNLAARNAVRFLSGRSSTRWLLIFDDADDPDDLIDLVPVTSSGQILITSRNPKFDTIAEHLMLEPFSREQAVNFLKDRSGDHSDAEEAAADLADELGGLPLALEHAGTYCRAVGIGLNDYLSRFRAHRTRLLRDGVSRGTVNVDVTLRLAFKQAAKIDRAATQLLCVLAFMSPSDVPRALFAHIPRKVTPRQLSRSSRDPLLLDRTIGALRQTSLVTVITPTTLRVHRLVSDTLRQQVESCTRTLWQRLFKRIAYWLPFSNSDNAAVWTAAQWIRAGIGILAEYVPADERTPECWERAAVLLPHAQTLVCHLEEAAANIDEKTAVALTRLLSNLGINMFRSGKYHISEELCRQAIKFGRTQLPLDNSEILTAMNYLAQILHGLNNLQEARDIDEQLVAIFERKLGREHLDTVAIMNNLAGILMEQESELQHALDLIEHVTAIRRARLGDNDLTTIIAINNTAKILRHLGRVHEARELSQTACQRASVAVGPEHPDTLVMLNNLAETLRIEGNLAASKDLHQRTVDTRIRVIGLSHPSTLTSMNNLARVLRLLGENDNARDLYNRTLDIASTVLGEDHPCAISARNGIRDLEDPASSSSA